MHEEWEIRNLPREEKTWKSLKNHKGRGLEWERWCLGDEEMVFGRWTGADRSREIEETRIRSRRNEYINPQ